MSSRSCLILGVLFLIIIEVISNECTGTYPQKHKLDQSATELEYSFDGLTLLYCADGGSDEVIIYDIATGSNIWVQNHGDTVYACRFSPNADFIASGGYNNYIRIWDVSSPGSYISLIDHTLTVFALAFHPDPSVTVLASGGDDDTIKIWDYMSGTLHATLTGHTNRVQKVVFSPSGDVLASGSFDYSIKLWNASTLNSDPTQVSSCS